MKILFVLEDLGPVGGVARSTAELLPALSKLGVELSVVCLRETPESFTDDLRQRGIAVRMLPAAGNGRQALLALRRVIREERPAVVHTAKFFADMLGRLAAAGLPVVVVSSLVNTPDAPTRRSMKLRLADRWTAHHLTDHFHAVGHSTKRYGVRELGLPERRITVIERGRDLGRLGAPTDERRCKARAALGIHPDAPVIVTTGRQHGQKDQATLLTAFDRVASSHPEAVLLLAGREGDATQALLGQHQRLSHGDRVRILGHRNDVPELLAAADVFAFPSLWEGFSGSVLEAMALGLPVVASDIGPMREAVEGGVTGMLVPTRDPRELARALSSLLDDPDRARELGAAGRRLFLERYTIERSAERMRDLYAGLLSDQRREAA